MRSEDLLAFLDEIGIIHATREHPPVFTVEEAKALRGEIPGAHAKNLFLRDKKGAMFLVSALEDRAIDLKKLRAPLGAKNLSFGSKERLMEYLKVEPGSVTPFALIQEEAKDVTFVLDREFLDHSHVSFHPLVNTATTTLTPTELLHFAEATGHPPLLLDFSALPESD